MRLCVSAWVGTNLEKQKKTEEEKFFQKKVFTN
jgi:hypothetical protein